MPKVSIIILTKDRLELLKNALNSVFRQNFSDLEILVVNDGSSDGTEEYLKTQNNIQVINHQTSKGITTSRQEGLTLAKGEYVAFLDDDDEWFSQDKITHQVEYLDQLKEVVLVGSNVFGHKGESKSRFLVSRPETDFRIRANMLLKNSFFTSSVMCRREAALKVGGFAKDEVDLAEDYDLWLRLGAVGKMYNFQTPFVLHRLSDYNPEKQKQFLQKQLKLIKINKNIYPKFWVAYLILRLRLILRCG